MTENLLNSINILLEKIYKSVEGNVYELLDKLVTISDDILKQEPLKYIFKDDNGVVFVATSLIFFYIVQYMLMKLIAMYNGNNPENAFKFILRIIITIAIASSTKYICELVLQINDTPLGIVNFLILLKFPASCCSSSHSPNVVLDSISYIVPSKLNSIIVGSTSVSSIYVAKDTRMPPREVSRPPKIF